MRRATRWGLGLAAILLAAAGLWVAAGEDQPPAAGEASPERNSSSRNTHTPDIEPERSTTAGAAPAPESFAAPPALEPFAIATADAARAVPGVAPEPGGSTSRAEGELSADAGASPCRPVVVPAISPAVCSMRTEIRARAVFLNDCPATPVTVSWVNFACQEKGARLLAVGQSFATDTFVAHNFRVRAAASGELLREWSPALGSGTTLVRVCGCTGAVETRLDEAPMPDGGFHWPDAGEDFGEDAGIPFVAPVPLDAGVPSQCSLSMRTAPVNVTFFNNCLGTEVEAWWVDYRCAERRYFRLPPGDRKVQQTFVGHPWRVRLPDGGPVLAEFTALAPIPTLVPACP